MSCWPTNSSHIIIYTLIAICTFPFLQHKKYSTAIQLFPKINLLHWVEDESLRYVMIQDRKVWSEYSFTWEWTALEPQYCNEILTWIFKHTSLVFRVQRGKTQGATLLNLTLPELSSLHHFYSVLQ